MEHDFIPVEKVRKQTKITPAKIYLEKLEEGDLENAGDRDIRHDFDISLFP